MISLSEIEAQMDSLGSSGSSYRFGLRAVMFFGSKQSNSSQEKKDSVDDRFIGERKE